MYLTTDLAFWFWAVILPAAVIVGVQVWIVIQLRGLRAAVDRLRSALARGD